MKDYRKLKQSAISLRHKGLSYKEIGQKIKMTKSTLSYWLKDVPLKEEHRRRLYTKQIEVLSRGSQSQKERRFREVETIISNAQKEIRTPISREDLKLMGAALYWGEGSKGKRVVITNSDPRLIKFSVLWIKSVFNTSPSQLEAQLNMYPQQNEKDLKKFWSELTGIPLENFGKTYVKPLSKNYKKNNLYYGTIKIGVPKSANKVHQIFGWIKAVLEDLEPKVKKIENKWGHLKDVPRPINLTPHNLTVK